MKVNLVGLCLLSRGYTILAQAAFFQRTFTEVQYQEQLIKAAEHDSIVTLCFCISITVNRQFNISANNKVIFYSWMFL